MAYNTLVRPQVEYASAIWSSNTKENINKIEKVKRSAARWVSNDYSTYSSVTDMLSDPLKTDVSTRASLYFTKSFTA